MARILPATLETAPEASRPMLQNLQQAFGRVPNLFATIGQSSHGLAFVLQGTQLLSNGLLSAREVEAINVYASELNGCAYCVAAHATLGKRVGLDTEGVAAVREGRGATARETAILSLVRRVIRTGGAGAGTELARAREAGLTDAELIEVLAHVALKAFTNAVAIVAQSDLDFPRLPELPTL